MAGKFAHILGFLGLAGNSDPVTEAHLQAADDKIAQLETDKAAADLQATQAEGARVAAQTALDAAQAEVTKTAGELATASGKLATLETWKKNQAAADGRIEDESNKHDADSTPKAAFELEAEAQISRVKARLGEAK